MINKQDEYDAKVSLIESYFGSRVNIAIDKKSFYLVVCKPTSFGRKIEREFKCKHPDKGTSIDEIVDACNRYIFNAVSYLVRKRTHLSINGIPTAFEIYLHGTPIASHYLHHEDGKHLWVLEDLLTHKKHKDYVSFSYLLKYLRTLNSPNLADNIVKKRDGWIRSTSKPKLNLRPLMSKLNDTILTCHDTETSKEVTASLLIAIIKKELDYDQ